LEDLQITPAGRVSSGTPDGGVRAVPPVSDEELVMPDHDIPCGSQPHPFATSRRTVLPALNIAPIGVGLVSAGVLGSATAAAAPRELAVGMSGQRNGCDSIPACGDLLVPPQSP
jgi:hypothetical protein